MRVVRKLKRLARLGLYLGLGAATTLLAACTSNTSRTDAASANPGADAGVVDGAVADGAGTDRTVPDASAADAARGDSAVADSAAPDTSAPDSQGWDLPLE